MLQADLQLSGHSMGNNSTENVCHVLVLVSCVSAFCENEFSFFYCNELKYGISYAGEAFCIRRFTWMSSNIIDLLYQCCVF